MISERLTRNVRPLLESEIKTYRFGESAGMSCLAVKAGSILADYNVGFEKTGPHPITGESRFRLEQISGRLAITLY